MSTGIDNLIKNYLAQFRLSGALNAYERQLLDCSSIKLSFDERLCALLQHEETQRKENRLKRLMQQAKFRYDASCEGIDYNPQRGLTRDILFPLMEGRWLREKLNLLITGPTGVGKSWIACALGNKAC